MRPSPTTLDRLSALAQAARTRQQLRDRALKSIADQPIAAGDLILLPCVDGLPVEGLVLGHELDSGPSSHYIVALADDQPALGPGDYRVLLDEHQVLVVRTAYRVQLPSSEVSVDLRSGRIEDQDLTRLQADRHADRDDRGDPYAGDSAYREWRATVLEPALARLNETARGPAAATSDTARPAESDGVVKPWREASLRRRVLALVAGWLIALGIGFFLARLMPPAPDSPSGTVVNPVLLWIGSDASLRSLTTPLGVVSEPLLLLFELAHDHPSYGLAIVDEATAQPVFQADGLVASGTAELAVLVEPLPPGTYRMTLTTEGESGPEVLAEERLRVVDRAPGQRQSP